MGIDQWGIRSLGNSLAWEFAHLGIPLDYTTPVRMINNTNNILITDRHFPIVAQICILFISLLLGFFGLSFNLICASLIVLDSKKMKSTSHFLLVNQCLSDLICILDLCILAAIRRVDKLTRNQQQYWTILQFSVLSFDLALKLRFNFSCQTLFFFNNKRLKPFLEIFAYFCWIAHHSAASFVFIFSNREMKRIVQSLP
uniref:Uncharacterized protein n=1 Tax=Romanomermis culicivorax TaxID=13658 RepID=A0A915LAU9_ROMCU